MQHVGLSLALRFIRGLGWYWTVLECQAVPGSYVLGV